jgi:propanol-preferring alcohol dehydrogenase
MAELLGLPDACLVSGPSLVFAPQAVQNLAQTGVAFALVLVGLPKDNQMQLPIFETVLGGIHLTRSIVGTRVDLQEVFELHAMGRTRVIPCMMA